VGDVTLDPGERVVAEAIAGSPPLSGRKESSAGATTEACLGT
jgi:hypothetical protein